MTHEVLFCLTTRPSLAAGTGEASISGSWTSQPGPLSSRGPHRDCIRVGVAVDWEPGNRGPGSLGVSNSPEEKSGYPKPGVTASLPAPKASLPQAQEACVLSFLVTNQQLWVEFRVPGAQSRGRAGFPAATSWKRRVLSCALKDPENELLYLLCYR